MKRWIGQHASGVLARITERESAFGGHKTYWWNISYQDGSGGNFDWEVSLAQAKRMVREFTPMYTNNYRTRWKWEEVTH